MLGAVAAGDDVLGQDAAVGLVQVDRLRWQRTGEVFEPPTGLVETDHAQTPR